MCRLHRLCSNLSSLSSLLTCLVTLLVHLQAQLLQLLLNDLYLLLQLQHCLEHLLICHTASWLEVLTTQQNISNTGQCNAGCQSEQDLLLSDAVLRVSERGCQCLVTAGQGFCLGRSQLAPELVEVL